MAIQMRRGQLANYDKSKMLPGEWGISIDNDSDNQKAFISFAPGVSKEVMMVEDAEEQIAVATAEAIDMATEEAEAWAHGNNFHVNDYASGDGSTRAFTLAETPSSILGVYVNGSSVSAYTLSGKTITFTTAPASGSNNIRVYYTVNTTADNAKYYKEQAKAVADSIPEDYSDLSDDVAQIKNTLDTKANASDVTSAIGAINDIILPLHEYNPHNEYSPSDWAVYNGEIYECLKATTGTFDSTKWRKVRYPYYIEDIKDSLAVPFRNDYSYMIEYYPGDYCVYCGTLWKCTNQTSDPPLISGINTKWKKITVAEEISSLKNALTTKAEQDGAYPDLTAGQMLSKNESADSVPYNFRAVGHDATLEYTDAIVGGSVMANQLYIANERTHSSGVVITRGGYGEAIFNGTASSTDNTASITTTISVYAGHKYILLGGTSNYPIRANNGGTSPSVFTYSQDSVTAITFPIISGTTYSNFHIYGIFADLTAMLGTTIADYVYTLETATSGAGVAWLRKHFPKLFTYQEYNAGEIVSVQGLSQHVTVGKNRFNKNTVTQSSWLSPTTGLVESASDYCVSDYIAVFKNVSVYIPKTNSARRWFYDYAKNPKVYLDNSKTQIYTPAEDGYIRLTFNQGSENYIDLDTIQVEFGSVATVYEPYVKRTYPLDSSLTLRGIPRLDASNHLFYDGDRYLPDGTVQRRYGVRAYQNGDVTDGSTMITDGTNTVYKLTTPTTEEADPYTVPQIIDPDGTEEFVTTSIVPVGHESRYPDDLRAKIDALPWNLSMIAPIENGDKASQAYAVGKYFLHNNQFCKAKTAIASGATLTLNTNYEVTTVADEIYSALH